MSKFLTEGAGGGHMWHPFDLPDVTTGKDLLDFFQKRVMAYVSTNQNPDIKLDGSNATVKLIRTEDNNYQFAVDRGSASDLDVGGVIIDKLAQRFPKKVVLQLLETGDEISSNVE